LDKKDKNTEETSYIGNGKPVKKIEQKLKCINIDCVFNSSNDAEHIRNTCNHPNVKVDSKYADITIAICSEFRSKKDYSFEKPAVLIDLKTKEKIEVIGEPNPATSSVEKITTEELESGVSNKDELSSIHSKEIPSVKPTIIEAKSELKADPAELYNFFNKPGSNFPVLRNTYKPFMKRAVITSVIVHFAAMFVMYLFLVPAQDNPDEQQKQQRIVVVEDIETPKFDPPDVDKAKEDEQKQEEKKVENNTKTVRPKIISKNIKPRIIRPKDLNERDTSKSISKPVDTTKSKPDSLLTKRDTTKFVIPDSLKNLYDQNAVGLKVSFPKNWKLQDNRDLNLNQKEFNGVIINTDSLSEDPGGVTMFIIIDDPQHSAFNRTTYKNPFLMDDTVSSAFVTDPAKGGGKKMTMKYFVFTDPSGQKNLQVNVEFANPAMLEKYQKVVDAVVRSVKIAPPAPKTP